MNLSFEYLYELLRFFSGFQQPREPQSRSQGFSACPANYQVIRLDGLSGLGGGGPDTTL